MGLFDSIQATPRNGLLGLLSDTLSGAYDAAGRIPERIDAGRIKGLLNLLGVPAVAATTDRMSYGEPLTNAGKANVPLLRPETADAAMAVAPVAAKWPREVAGSVLGLLGIADTGALSKAATVWHGSPHKFDAFDASKIGTGEGAQAYGHGLYLAESPDVARQYAEALGTHKTTMGGKPVTPDMPDFAAIMEVAARGYDKALADAKSALASGFVNPVAQSAHIASLERIAPFAKSIKQVQEKSIYKVDLPDSAISRMLDWDKPLSQQAPEVLAAIKKSKVGRDFYKNYGQDSDYAEAFYRYLAEDKRMGGKAASELRAAGIPGIRYLDGGSRGAGAGTSNYVVFPGEEGLLKILERNGQALP